jgi:hypothetical protein
MKPQAQILSWSLKMLRLAQGPYSNSGPTPPQYVHHVPSAHSISTLGPSVVPAGQAAAGVAADCGPVLVGLA